MPGCLKKEVEDVFLCAIYQAWSNYIGYELRFISLATLDDKFLCADVGFEIWMCTAASVIIFCKWDFWVILGQSNIDQYIKK